MKQEEDFDPCAPEDARDFAEFLKAGSPNPFLIYEEHSQIPKLIPETPKFTNMSEEVKPKTAVDLPTEFDSPTFIGASAANSIAVSRFEEAYHSRPPWDIDGPQPHFARLLGTGLSRRTGMRQVRFNDRLRLFRLRLAEVFSA